MHGPRLPAAPDPRVVDLFADGATIDPSRLEPTGPDLVATSASIAVAALLQQR